jgi:hypothetical protein
LTRSHHFLSAEANKPPTIHIAGNDGVTYVNVYRRSLSSSLNYLKTEVLKYSRLARTPPSTFLFLHLHLSNSPGPKAPSHHGGSILKPPSDDKSQPISDRLLIHSSKRGASQARKLAVAEGQSSAALSGRVIGPPNRGCQRSLSTNRRIVQIFCAAKAPCF